MSWQSHLDCPSNGDTLCRVDEIPDGGGFEVVFGEGKENFKILLLRKKNACWTYLNACPHFSLPLNYRPQTFLMSEGMVVCAHHTAFFRVESGDCVDGPCAGTGLTKLPSYILDEHVYFGHPPKAKIQSQNSDA